MDSVWAAQPFSTRMHETSHGSSVGVAARGLTDAPPQAKRTSTMPAHEAITRRFVSPVPMRSSRYQGSVFPSGDFAQSVALSFG